MQLTGDESWVGLCDAYYDRASNHESKQHNFGPCALVFPEGGAPRSWQVRLENYSTKVIVPLGSGNVSMAFALYDSPDSTNAEAFARVRVEASGVTELLREHAAGE